MAAYRTPDLEDMDREVADATGESPPPSNSGSDAQDWDRARRERRQAVRELPEVLQGATDKIRRHDLGHEIASTLVGRLLEEARHWDGLPMDPSSPLDEAAMRRAEREVERQNEVTQGASPRPRRFTTTVPADPSGVARQALSAVGRRKVERKANKNPTLVRQVRREVHRQLRQAHVGPSGIDRQEVPDPRRSYRIIEGKLHVDGDLDLVGTDDRRCAARLEAPPDGWVAWALAQPVPLAVEDTDDLSLDVPPARVLLLGEATRTGAILADSFPALEIDLTPETDAYDRVVVAFPSPAAPAGANQVRIYEGAVDGDLGIVGVKRWTKMVRRTLRALSSVVVEGGDVYVLLPLGVRHKESYAGDLRLIRVINELNDFEVRRVHEVVEESPRAWPFVFTSRPRRLSIRLTKRTSATTGIISVPAVDAAVVDEGPAPRSNEVNEVGANPLRDLSVIRRHVTLDRLARADARTRDALGIRIADVVQTTADIENLRTKVRQLADLAPEALERVLTGEPLRLAEFRKSNGPGMRTVAVPTLTRRVWGLHIAGLLCRRVEALFPVCVRAYREGQRNGVHEAIVDVAEAIQHGRLRYFAKLDIVNFFGRIPHSLVAEAMKHFGFDDDMIEVVLASLRGSRAVQGRPHRGLQPMQLTQGRGIHQGLPEAPALANMVPYALDSKLSRNRRLTYLRWCDDLLIGSSSKSEVVGAVRAVMAWCRAHGFTLKGVSPNQRAASLVHDVRRTRIEFLGAEIDHRGMVHMPEERLTAKLAVMDYRAERLAGEHVTGVSSYAAGGRALDIYDEADLAEVKDGFVRYWAPLDPVGAHRAEAALEERMALTPAISAGRATTWTALLPAGQVERGPADMNVPPRNEQHASAPPAAGTTGGPSPRYAGTGRRSGRSPGDADAGSPPSVSRPSGHEAESGPAV